MATYKKEKGFTIQSLTSDPSPLLEGQVWYNTTSTTLKGSINVLGVGAWATPNLYNQNRDSKLIMRYKEF